MGSRSWTTTPAGGVRTCPRARPSTSWTSGPAETRALAAREVDGEGGPLARAALDGNPAAVVLGYVLDDGEPQSSPAGRLGACLVHAVEALEDARQLGLGDADAGVGDPDHDLRTLKAARHLHPPARQGVL